jgi:hypothetical protein
MSALWWAVRPRDRRVFRLGMPCLPAVVQNKTSNREVRPHCDLVSLDGVPNPENQPEDSQRDLPPETLLSMLRLSQSVLDPENPRYDQRSRAISLDRDVGGECWINYQPVARPCREAWVISAVSPDITRPVYCFAGMPLEPSAHLS